MKITRILVGSGVCLALLLTIVAGRPAARSGQAAAWLPTDALKRLQWRNIGPTAQTGRTPVFVGLPGDPATFYVAGANGGIFKTTNRGARGRRSSTTRPCCRSARSRSRPPIRTSSTSAPAKGTRATTPRSATASTSRPTRAAWTHVGLADSERIARILVDPRNPTSPTSARSDTSGGRTRSAGSSRRPTAARTGRRCCTSNGDRAAPTSTSIPPTRNIVYAGMWTFRR